MMRKQTQSDAHRWNTFGVYAHLIFDPNDAGFCGVYVGSARCVSARIKQHERDYQKCQRWKKPNSTRSKQPKQLTSPHLKLWNRRKGVQSLWILLGHVDRRSTMGKDQAFLVLNILEMYSMLLLRTLPSHTLWRYLPQGARLSLVSWNGLNVTTPLDQWRSEFGFSPMNSARPRAFKYATARNEAYRDADPSLGDKPVVEVVCNNCRSAGSRRTDYIPRYEISSGKYLHRFRSYCPECSTGKMVTFVPIDKSLPSKSYDYLRHTSELDRLLLENPPSPKTRSQMCQLSLKELKAWLMAHGFARRKYQFGTREHLLKRAEAVWDSLHSPQDANAKEQLQQCLNSSQTIYDRPSRAARNVHKIRHLDSTRCGVPIDYPSAKTASKEAMDAVLQAQKLQTNPRTHTVEIRTTEVLLPSLEFLGSIDLSTYPRCKRCFRRRLQCDQRPLQRMPAKTRLRRCRHERPSGEPPVCVECLGRETVGAAPVPRASELLTITPSTFPKCDACFRRRSRCSGGNPCQCCQKMKLICIDVTEASLKAHPDRAKHVLDLSSRGPITVIRCRYCTSQGQNCHRESPTAACNACVRSKRRCTNDIQGIKIKGRSKVLS